MNVTDKQKENPMMTNNDIVCVIPENAFVDDDAQILEFANVALAEKYIRDNDIIADIVYKSEL